MPIYEYRCQSCGHEMEALVRSGKEPEACPECQGALARKISRAGIIFKGSGFYVNDSRGSNTGAGGSSSGGKSSSTSSDSGKSSSSSESKTSSDSSSSSSSSNSSSSPSSPSSPSNKSSD